MWTIVLTTKALVVRYLNHVIHCDWLNIFIVGFSEKLEFQAETRMLLDIVAKSLYSEKEVCDGKHNSIGTHYCTVNSVWIIFLFRFLSENWFQMPAMHWKNYAILV
jgi:hypothetical protein